MIDEILENLYINAFNMAAVLSQDKFRKRVNTTYSSLQYLEGYPKC